MPRRRNRARMAERDAREVTLRLRAFRQWIAASREAAELDDFFERRQWNARYAADRAHERERAGEKKRARERRLAQQKAAQPAPAAGDLESLYRAWKSL